MVQHLRTGGALGTVLAALLLLLAGAPHSAGAETEPLPESVMAPKWQRAIPSSTCLSGGLNCHRGSPTLADVDNDGRSDIVIATHAGHIVALKDDGSSDGRVLWDVDIAGYIGMAPGTAVISSTPAVADIDKNDGGRVEVVVGFGYELCCDTRGGVIVLEHNGAVKAGWPKLTTGVYGNGNPMPVISSPALGDLDQDGDLEIIYGGIDGRIYARHHNGALLPGFAPSSYLLQRFPFWDDLVGRLGDDTWSSPALGDVDGDGYLDIVIGASEGNFDDRWGGDSGGWSCPYPLPAGWAPGYCGGSLYVFNRFGQILPGFPQYFLEIIQSSPALADVDGDGRMEIFVGTGSFYRLHSPANPTYGFRAYGFDDNGAPLPGWSGGKPTNGVTQSSPSIGNIAGDAAPEIIFGARDGRIHAFHINGQNVSGFPMLARSRVGVTSDFDVGKSFVLADYDGDSKMEIFANVGESVVIVDGNGQQLTSSSNGTDGKPAFGTGGWLFNSPAVGNVDGDSALELIAFDRFFFVWDLPGTAGNSAAWGQFKRDAAGQSRAPVPGYLSEAPASVGLMCPSSGTCAPAGLVTLVNNGDEPLGWQVNSGGASWRVSFPASSGTIPARSTRQVAFAVNTGGLSNGMHDLGSVSIATTNSAGSAGTISIPLWLYKGTIRKQSMPSITTGQ